MQVLDVAKGAGFSLDEARVQLQHAEAETGTPAFESLRELAARKLPEVQALITRAQAMRSWLLTATDCSCRDTAAAAADRDGPGRSPRPARSPADERAGRQDRQDLQHLDQPGGQRRHGGSGSFRECDSEKAATSRQAAVRANATAAHQGSIWLKPKVPHAAASQTAPSPARRLAIVARVG
jgi:MerR-like DNA binding protein